MTSKEFAKLIGVSQSTVSRAMNGSDLVPEEKRKFILQKARECGFVLNSQAKSLRTQRTDTIGILFPKHFVGMGTNLMLAHIYDCIQKEMHNYDYDLMTIYYKTEESDFSSFERLVRKRKVDGFLVLRMELSEAEIQLIEEYQVPCVFIMNAGAKIRPNLNYLFSDSVYGGTLAGRYLGSFKDYQKMFISIKEEHEDAERRLNGYRSGLKERGCELREEDILYCNLGITSAYECILANKERFVGKKTAIFAYSDMIGIGAVNAFRDMGYSIPQDVQVIGMDDILLASTINPKLSTMHISVEEMVPRGCELLIDLIEKKDRLVQEWIRPRLILRETTLSLDKSNTGPV